VHRPLWILRGFYLVTGLSGGVFVPYLSLWLARDGLSSSQIGEAMAIGTAVAILMQPVWGWIVDRYHWTRPTLLLSTAIPGALAICYNAPWFGVITLVNILSTVFSVPQTPIADNYAVACAKAHGTSYGTIRCFGSLGFALGAYAGGWYLEAFAPQTLWVPFAALSLIGAVLALMLPVDHVDVSLSARMGEGLRELLQSRTFLVFLLGGLLVSQTLTAFNTYFALAFRMIGGSMAATGIAFLIASAMNVPAMLVAAYVIRRIGRGRTMLLAALFYVIRWGVQAAIPSPAVAVAIQVLHGVSFGFFYVAAVDYVARTARSEVQATAQSLFNMVCVSMAGIIGNLVNGFLFRAGGPTAMYWTCSGSALVAMGCFWYVVRQQRIGRVGHRPVASSANSS
jgi:PPP family 3-phenylpropionic acid transporter